MTELQLYSFINENSVETKYSEGDPPTWYAWISHLDLAEFCDLVGGDQYLSDAEIDVRLLNHYVCIDLYPICEYFEINPKNLLKND